MIGLPTPVNRQSISAFGGRSVVLRRADVHTVTEIDPVAPGSRTGRRPKLLHHIHREPTGGRQLLAGSDVNLIDAHTISNPVLTEIPLYRMRAHAQASAAYCAADTLSLHFFHAAIPFDIKA